MIYKFVKWDVPKLDTLENTRIYQLHDKLMVRGEQATREEKNYLFDSIHMGMIKYGVHLHGWCFDFRNMLKEYWVEFNYGTIEKYYALDKTSIRQNDYMTEINKIVEVK